MSSEHKVKQIGIAITLVSYTILVARAVCHAGHRVIFHTFYMNVCVFVCLFVCLLFVLEFMN